MMSILKRNVFVTLLSFVLCLTCVFAFVGCDEAEQGSEVTEEVWNAALSEETLKNVTIKFSGTVETQTRGDEITVQQDYTLKIVDGRAHIVVLIDGKEGLNTSLDGEQMRNGYLQVLSVLLDQRGSFTFDEGEKEYYLEGPITEKVTANGISGNITMKDSYVRFDDQGKPVYFQCDFTQANKKATDHTDGTWTFSDYGTTVIDG